MRRTYNYIDTDFLSYPTFDGELGVLYSSSQTTICLWAPNADRILLRLYSSGTSDKVLHTHEMSFLYAGVWKIELHGDWKNHYYSFQVHDADGWLGETLDPTVKSTGINGLRGLIFDPEKTTPIGWNQDKGPLLNSPVDAVIYELHVRDFTIHESSSVLNQGKYLGLVEPNTRTKKGGEYTGMAHLKELGITHVHLLPISDFYTVNENPDNGNKMKSPEYNWGYDPQHFNSPEGSYSCDPWDGVARVREVKTMVHELHKNDIGVVLDVVYNHTGLIKLSSMNQTVPGYYYRQDENGDFSNASGCGNELASERPMVRKFIVDSLCYWAREYHVDGFRFDLMGVLDIVTMNLIQEKLQEINPHILLYGEGWTADTCPLPESERAVKSNISKLNGIAGFNDDFRDGIKGGNFDVRSKGFITGETLNEEVLKFGVVGATAHPQINFGFIKSSPEAWANHPTQCVNYVSCHDNFTLVDKVNASCTNSDINERKQRIKLALALNLTSQGIPFLHAGVDILRSKQGNHNSYRSSDLINAIDWTQKEKNRDVFDFVRDFIQLRKDHPAFRLQTKNAVDRCIHFSNQYHPGTLFYSLKNENEDGDFTTYLLFFNANKSSLRFSIPHAEWLVVADQTGINPVSSTKTHLINEIEVSGISTLILATKQEIIKIV